MAVSIITHESLPQDLSQDDLIRARLNRAVFRLSQAATLMEEAHTEMVEQGGYSRELRYQVQDAIAQLRALIKEVCDRIERLG